MQRERLYKKLCKYVPAECIYFQATEIDTIKLFDTNHNYPSKGWFRL